IFQEKLKYFFLTGEFSESPYLQYKLKNYYEKKNIILVIPRVPTLAIARGAPQLGLFPFTSCPLHRIFHVTTFIYFYFFTTSSVHNVVTVLQDVEEWMKPTIANAKKLTGKPLVKALTDKELAKIEQDSKEQMIFGYCCKLNSQKKILKNNHFTLEYSTKYYNNNKKIIYQIIVTI
ncbi:hypothetical protein RFI_34405, partial [Reticulomyxa filosa]